MRFVEHNDVMFRFIDAIRYYSGDARMDKADAARFLAESLRASCAIEIPNEAVLGDLVNGWPEVKVTGREDGFPERDASADAGSQLDDVLDAVGENG